MSCKPSNEGSDVLTSMTIWDGVSSSRLEAFLWGTDLVCHLNQLRSSTNRGSGHNASVFQDIGSFHDDNIELV